MQVGFKSDKGLRRSNNEDACFVLLPDKVYVVADGVRGGNAGEIASRTAVNEIANYFSDEQADKIINSEKEKLYNMLGNSAIKLMKEYKEITAEMLLFNLYEVMSKLEEQEDMRANSNDFINSLSTNARKEWARRMSYGSDELEM